MPRDDLELATGGDRPAIRASSPGAEAPPAVVVVSSATGDLDHAMLVDHLHATLPDAGIAAITPRTGPPLDRGAVVELLERVRSSGAVDPARVGLWAFGESTRLAIAAAAEEPVAAFAILVSPSAVTPARRLAYATARVMRALGADDATVRRVSGLRRRLDDAFRRGAAASMRASVDAVREEPWFADAPLPDPDDRSWAATMDVDLAEAIGSIEIPVLVTHGEDDRWVPIDESVEICRRAYRGPRLDVVRLPRTGHLPTIAEDPNDLEERGPISAGYERALLAFLAREVSRPSAPDPRPGSTRRA